EIRFRNGRSLGKVEEQFAASLRNGDTFRFAGMDLEVEALRDLDLIVRAARRSATIPSYMGLRLPLTTHLADRVRELLVDRARSEIRFRNGRSLGKVEEQFAASLRNGDTFRFAGMDLEVEALRDLDLIVRAARRSATIPSYMGLRLPLTTHLADRVRELLVDRA